MADASQNAAKPILLAGVIGGLLGAAIAGGGVWLAERQKNRPLAQIEDAQNELLAKFDQLSTRQQAAPQAPEIAALTERLDLLEQDAARIETLDKLQTEINQLEELYRAEISTLRGARAKTAAAALALREITAAVDDGKNFRSTLERLRGTLDDDFTVQRLTRELEIHAGGVSSLQKLAKDLDTIRIEAIRAAGSSEGSWVNRTVENLRALIDVDGLPELKGMDGLMRDAREKTILNQLPKAIAELEPLTEEVPDLRAWLERARARQQTLSHLSELDRHLDERVNTQG